jgi:hypothetical protein
VIIAGKIDVRKDQAAFDFPQAAVPPKAKGVGKKKGKMTREESARILGIQYKGDDEYDG